MSNVSRTLFLLLSVSFFPFFLSAQEKVKVEGYVIDDSSNATLPGATIQVLNGNGRTSTDRKGRYELRLPPGTYRILVSYVGYKDLQRRFEVQRDRRMNLRLTPNPLTMRAVEVQGEKENANINDPQMSRMEMDVEKLEELPNLLGEVDILRSIKLLPGVRSGGNGNSGISVRGGAPYQNMVMLDEAVVYRPTHLFGSFSVFNGGAIDEVEMIKGGIPARYGKRLSSILDVSMKGGDWDRIQGQGGIGLLSSRFTVHGPIKKDTTTFMLAARRTYADLVMEPFIPENSAFHGSTYHFYDLNAKVRHRLSDKDVISLSAYMGSDQFRFDDGNFQIEIPWGNRLASLQWDHRFNEDLNLESSLVFSDYEFSFNGEQSNYGLSMYSSIRDLNLNTDLVYDASAHHKLRAGISYDRHRFTPTHADAETAGVNFDAGDLDHIHANEGAAYLSDRISITDRFIVHPGIRFSAFNQVGPFERFVQDDLSRVLDTVRYERGEEVARYSGWEPRLAMRYRFRPDLSVKASYTRNYQYLHMASISPVSLPTDVWLPSTELVKPQIGDQWAVGVYKNFLDHQLEGSIELYYRTMENLVEFESGALAENSIQTNIDAQLTFGDGRSYGAEFFLKKKMGKLNGWLSYTLSKSTRSFPEIDDGEPFPANYDRRHDLSLTASWEFAEKWSVGATFVYTSGKAVTLPDSRYLIEGRVATEYQSRNSFRMKPYHRADLSLRFKPGDRKEKRDPRTGELLKIPQRVRSEWVLSIYNVYNRANPYFLYFDNQGSLSRGNLNVSAQQVTLFPILPSISWEFEF